MIAGVDGVRKVRVHAVDPRSGVAVGVRTRLPSGEYIVSPGGYEIGRTSRPELPRIDTAGLAFRWPPESARHDKRHVAEGAPTIHLGTTPRATKR
jgi:hypothetical protein